MKGFFEKIKGDKSLIASIIVCLIAVLVAALGFILLPDKIFVELFAQGAKPETSRNFFLISGVFVALLSAVMCFVSENVKKWLAAETVISIAFIGCVVYNLIVL